MSQEFTTWSKETLLQRRSSKMRKWSLPILRLACWSSTREGAPGSRAELHYRTAPARAFARYSIGILFVVYVAFFAVTTVQAGSCIAPSSDASGPCLNACIDATSESECTASVPTYNPSEDCNSTSIRDCETASAEGCIVGSGCPPGQVSGEGPCPAGQIYCVPAPAATSSGGTPAPSPTATPLELPNPLGTTNVPKITGRIIGVLSGGAGMIALLMFVYGGFQWLTAGGNAEKIKKGKDIILWSVLGMVVMFSSYLATRYIIETLVPAATR